MILTLQSFAHLPESTIGALSIDGVFECFTLEDEARSIKVAGETRIPRGTYQIRLQIVGRLHQKYAEKYPEFHVGMLALMNVPDFEGIMIHQGATPDHTAGCLLVGDVAMSSGQLADSASAYKRIYRKVSAALLSGEPVSIEVK